ncbi:hypothetical protein Clacol_008816 [Clathrus columnatus]|uniref:F-box domain-containing protein n=1 Tax=Clathrus columnatus TaxID=1419009 RepID=A0AAV5AIS4_9AGAM|nr:hypothetical protein Clacol_008816 [Clathrus columnatus]
MFRMHLGKKDAGLSAARQQRCIPVACRVGKQLCSISNKIAILNFICYALVPMDQWLTTHIDPTWYVQDLKIWLLSKALPSGVLSLPPSYRPSSPVLFADDAPKNRTLDVSNPSDANDNDDEPNSPVSDGFSISTANDILETTAYAHYIPNNNINVDSLCRSGLQSISPYSYKRGEFLSSDKISDSSLLIRTIALSKRWQVYSFSTGMLLPEEAPLLDCFIEPYYLFELHRTGDYVPLPKELPCNFWDVNLPSDLPISEDTVWPYLRPYFDTWIWVFTAFKVDKTSGKDVPTDSKQGTSKESLQSGGWKKMWIVIKDGFLSLYHEKGDGAPIGKLDLAECTGLSGDDKLKPIVNSHFYGLDPFALGFIPHWRQGVPTASQAPRNRNTKFSTCIRFRRSSWLLLDSPDRTTHEHLLRVVHRLIYFNPALLPDSLPSCLHPRRTLQTEFLPNPIPAPAAIRFAARSSPRSSPVSTIFDDGASASSKTTVGSISQIGLGDTPGVKFPEWREHVVRQAMVSTHGRSFEGIMWSKLLKNMTNPQNNLQDIDDHGYDSSSFSDISDEPSELEWRGWAYDLDRQKTSALLSSDRRNSTDSETGQQNIEHIPRHRTQSVFSLAVESSKLTAEIIPDMPATIGGGRTRSSTVSAKKTSLISPGKEIISLPPFSSGVESLTSRKLIRAFGGKGSGKLKSDLTHVLHREQRPAGTNHDSLFEYLIDDILLYIGSNFLSLHDLWSFVQVSRRCAALFTPLLYTNIDLRLQRVHDVDNINKSGILIRNGNNRERILITQRRIRKNLVQYPHLNLRVRTLAWYLDDREIRTNFWDIVKHMVNVEELLVCSPYGSPFCPDSETFDQYSQTATKQSKTVTHSSISSSSSTLYREDSNVILPRCRHLTLQGILSLPFAKHLIHPSILESFSIDCTPRWTGPILSYLSSSPASYPRLTNLTLAFPGGGKLSSSLEINLLKSWHQVLSAFHAKLTHVTILSRVTYSGPYGGPPITQPTFSSLTTYIFEIFLGGVTIPGNSGNENDDDPSESVSQEPMKWNKLKVLTLKGGSMVDKTGDVFKRLYAAVPELVVDPHIDREDILWHNQFAYSLLLR